MPSDFNIYYQQWIDAGGSRSPSVKAALKWMFDQMQEEVRDLILQQKEEYDV